MRLKKFSEKLAEISISPHLYKIDLAVANKDTDSVQAALADMLKFKRVSNFKWRKAINQADYSDHVLDRIDLVELMRQMSFNGHVTKWPEAISSRL